MFLHYMWSLFHQTRRRSPPARCTRPPMRCRIRRHTDMFLLNSEQTDQFLRAKWRNKRSGSISHLYDINMLKLTEFILSALREKIYSFYINNTKYVINLAMERKKNLNKKIVNKK